MDVQDLVGLSPLRHALLVSRSRFFKSLHSNFWLNYMVLAKIRRIPWKRDVMAVCGKLIPYSYHPPGGVLFPYGHIVSDVVPSHVKQLYSIPSVAKFKSDIDSLCRRFRPLKLSELESLLPLHRYPQTPGFFVLSFDDGMREIYDFVAPILREKGIPAIFFLNSATIDNRQLLWRHKVSLLIECSQKQPSLTPPQVYLRPGKSVAAKLKAMRYEDGPVLDDIARFYGYDFNDYLQSTKPYLTASQVLELSRAGFEVGAHSDTHPLFSGIGVEDQKCQISKSVQFIRQLGLPCRAFAFPFNDRGVSASVFTHMAKLGLQFSFGSSEACLDTISFSYQRFALDGKNSRSSFEDLLGQLSTKSLVRRLSGTDVINRSL